MPATVRPATEALAEEREVFFFNFDRSFHPKCVSPDLKLLLLGEKVDSPGRKVGSSEVFFMRFRKK